MGSTSSRRPPTGSRDRGGYAETFYRNELEDLGGADPADDSDLYRVVVYLGYRFTPRIVFNAEVEYEHQNEIHVEFAYLDFRLSGALGIRAGNVLVPAGFVNEMHEPPFFHGVFRPEVERNLIPSTWNDNGVGLYGEVAGLRYKAYLLVGLDAFGGTTLSAGTWMRNARTGARQAPAESFAGVLALGPSRAWPRRRRRSARRPAPRGRPRGRPGPGALRPARRGGPRR